MNIISLGAGVQSSTMALMAAHGEITPMPDAAIFADTQAEPKAVYEWLDWLTKQLAPYFPVYEVTAGDLGKTAIRIRTAKNGNKYAAPGLPVFMRQVNGVKSMGIRQCTQGYKITPITKKLKEIKGTDKEITQWVGISLDEAVRMKPHKEKWVKNRWPLIELRMTRNDCLRWMERMEYPKPPRSACVFCPYHTDAQWRGLALEDFNRAVDFEKALQEVYARLTVWKGGPPYLHSTMQPLDKVDFSTDEDRGQLNLFENECEGMCGV